MSAQAGLRLALLGLSVIVAMATPIAASERLDRLLGNLQIRETIAIMRDEGLLYGKDLADEMLTDGETDGWKNVVARIYDADKMYALIADSMGQELAQTDLTPLLAYFETEEARGIVQMEVAARRAFMDPGTEAAAQARHGKAREGDEVVLGQIDRLIKDSDLIEFNVMGALNANLMFYRGLSDGGAYEMSEEDILTDVWMQESDIRRETEDWLNAFLLMAYEPLPPGQLEEYSAVYRTKEGRDLNRAMFTAFDRMYDELSYLMGQAVAQYMQSEKL